MAVATSESVVKKIFSTDKRIKFYAVVDSEGKIEAGGMRLGFRFLEPKAETARIVTTALGYPVSKVATLGRYVNQLGTKA